MGSSKRLKSTLLPIAEHRQAKVCDSSLFGDAEEAAARQSSSRKGRRAKVLRPLVKLKNAFVELMMSESTPTGRSSAAYCPMGVVMGPVDFSGYGAVPSIWAH